MDNRLPRSSRSRKKAFIKGWFSILFVLMIVCAVSLIIKLPSTQRSVQKHVTLGLDIRRRLSPTNQVSTTNVQVSRHQGSLKESFFSAWASGVQASDDHSDEEVDGSASEKMALKYGLNLKLNVLTRSSTTSFTNLQGTPEERQQAFQMIRECVKAYPDTLGIVLVVSHQDVPPDIAYIPSQSEEENRRQERLSSLPGIEYGAQQLEKAFKGCGLTVIRLENPSKNYLSIVIRAMTLDRMDPMAIEYPASYRYSFFYTTGHGANRVFFTKDGSVSFQDIYSLYQGFLYQRYFFFDCCRCIRHDPLSMFPNGDGVIPSYPESSMSAENRIIYATISGSLSWAKNGVSFMTKKIVALLVKNLPMDEVISRLQEGLAKEVEAINGQRQQPTNYDATSWRIDLWKELRALKAKLQDIPRAPPNATSKFHQQDAVQFQMESQSGIFSEYQRTSDPINKPQPARPRANTTITHLPPHFPLQETTSYESSCPVISKCDSVVHFKDGQKVTISWKIRPSPYHHFIIHVYKEGTDDPVHSKEINFDSTKHCYEESFNVPGYTRGTYSVVVEAVRVSGQSVYSERTPLETSKSTTATHDKEDSKLNAVNDLKRILSINDMLNSDIDDQDPSFLAHYFDAFGLNPGQQYDVNFNKEEEEEMMNCLHMKQQNHILKALVKVLLEVGEASITIGSIAIGVGKYHVKKSSTGTGSSTSTVGVKKLAKKAGIQLTDLQKKVSDEFINRIARIPNFEWIPLAWQLKLQKQDIREISKNIVSQPDKVQAMLMKWRDNSKAQKTTYNYFINVLLQNFCADLAWNACNLIKDLQREA